MTELKAIMGKAGKTSTANVTGSFAAGLARSRSPIFTTPRSGVPSLHRRAHVALPPQGQLTPVDDILTWARSEFGNDCKSRQVAQKPGLRLGRFGLALPCHCLPVLECPH